MTTQTARQFLAHCIDLLGSGFHPDTPFTDYVGLYHGQRVFSDEAAANLQTRLDAAFEVLGEDVYEVGLELLTAHLEKEERVA